MQSGNVFKEESRRELRKEDTLPASKQVGTVDACYELEKPKEGIRDLFS